jgi:hypothetical protein
MLAIVVCSALAVCGLMYAFPLATMSVLGLLLMVVVRLIDGNGGES